MDFKDQIKQLAERVEKLRENITTEEATKNAFIMPFIQALGYDVFNPLEIIPEYTCDIGTKKGEKIDYAIMRDSKPAILVECKHWGQELNLHDNQLLRYYHVSPAKFGLLTNGIQYRFYTDLETPNKMDERPFLEVDILNLTDTAIEELKKFHKSYFDVENIMSSASELKYTRELKNVINNEFNAPSIDFVKMLARQVYDGLLTAKMVEQFTSLVKKSLQGIINDKINERIQSALVQEKVEPEQLEPQEVKEENSIITTLEELEAFAIVKSIVRTSVDLSRIMHKDTMGYFGIMVDNQKKTFCRLYFNNKNRYIATIDENRKEIKHPITSTNDIYNLLDAITKSLMLRIEEK